MRAKENTVNRYSVVLLHDGRPCKAMGATVRPGRAIVSEGRVKANHVIDLRSGLILDPRFRNDTCLRDRNAVPTFVHSRRLSISVSFYTDPCSFGARRCAFAHRLVSRGLFLSMVACAFMRYVDFRLRVFHVPNVKGYRFLPLTIPLYKDAREIHEGQPFLGLPTNVREGSVAYKHVVRGYSRWRRRGCGRVFCR